MEWNGEYVITTQDVAKEHGLEVRVINQKFRRNKSHFVLNVDYYIVDKKMITNCDDLFYHDSDLLYLFTRKGYLKFVKTINDDKAWVIYNRLISAYFGEKLTAESKFLEKSKENRKGLTGEWSKHNAKNYGMLTITEYESLFGDSEVRKAQMDDGELTLLSAFEFLEQRKLQNNPQINGDGELKESLQDTGLKINGIIESKQQLT